MFAARCVAADLRSDSFAGAALGAAFAAAFGAIPADALDAALFTNLFVIAVAKVTAATDEFLADPPVRKYRLPQCEQRVRLQGAAKGPAHQREFEIAAARVSNTSGTLQTAAARDRTLHIYDGSLKHVQWPSRFVQSLQIAVAFPPS